MWTDYADILANAHFIDIWIVNVDFELEICRLGTQNTWTSVSTSV